MDKKGVAFLWDESFLWGLMAYKALKGLGLPFELVNAEEIQTGVLDRYKMLFIPGGWASNKGKDLGDDGMEAIRDFVSRGGNYLGFCGGAGLATRAKGCLGLLNIQRRPSKERVPSFSGRIHLNVASHAIWKGRTTRDARRTTNIFHAWWPSQFVIKEEGIHVLASYGEALPDAFSSDLNVGDTEENGNWEELENVYGINLAPERLRDEPAVVEGRYGAGKVVLSLIHFDSPDDTNGQHVLINLWEYLANYRTCLPDRQAGNTENRHNPPSLPPESGVSTTAVPARTDKLFNFCSELISHGERNSLWFWRNSMLLHWRRGVRGMEYNTLYILMKEIVDITANQSSGGVACSLSALNKIEDIVVPFVEKAKKLLILEESVLQTGQHITYEKCDDPEMRKLRSELFSDSKSHGGMFKIMVDLIDEFLFQLLKIS
jgi:hypothetical protein